MQNIIQITSIIFIEYQLSLINFVIILELLIYNIYIYCIFSDGIR